MPKDLIGEILEKYALSVGSGEYVDDDENLCLKCLLIKTYEAKTSIISLMRKCVPEKINPITPEPYKSNVDLIYREGFNESINQMHQAIDKLEGKE